MSALKIIRPVAEEIGLLLSRIAEPIAQGDGLTAEELLDLRAWLRGVRAKHWDELRQARQGAVSAEIVNFRRVERAMAGERPCDSEAPERPGAA